MTTHRLKTKTLQILYAIWRDKSISLASKVKLMQTLILSTFLYACESWTLTAEIQRRIQALEMRCYRRLLNISYKDQVTNEEVRNRIQNATGVHDELFCLLLGPPGFNCWFSSAPVFQWCCSTPQESPGVGRNTFLSSPHLCFIIVFICDLFVSRDDPLMS